MEFGILEQLARRGYLVVAVEPRGTGLTRVERQREAAISQQFRQLFDTETVAAYTAWFMDESLLGMRVLYVLRAVDYTLARYDVDRGGLYAVGVGRAANWLLFGAALDQRIRSLVCDHGLLSYKILVQADRYRYGADMFLGGVLQKFDLPQVAASIADRRLSLLSPLDAMKRTVRVAAAESAYEWTRRIHSSVRPGGQLLIAAHAPEAQVADQYLRAWPRCHKIFARNYTVLINNSLPITPSATLIRLLAIRELLRPLRAGAKRMGPIS
jgi:pimeloyl-ACP methyl ester carboxylesterase